MPTAPKQAAILATLRQIAVQGLPGAMAHEALAKAVVHLIPGDMLCFMRHDSPERLADAWINQPELLPDLGVFLSEFYDGREAEAYPAYRDFLRGRRDVDLLHDPAGRLLDSAVYHELYKKIDFRYIVRAAFREGGIARGCLTLTRGHRSRDFSREELRQLAGVLPYVTHALHVPVSATPGREHVETAEGLLICNASGEVEYASPLGRTLLHDIAEVPVTAATLSDRCLGWAAPTLCRLVGDAARLAGGRPAAAPVVVKDNARGRYVLRVWQLAATAGAGMPGLYSVSIRRQVPLALRLLENPQVLALPMREKQVCLLLAEGLETREIARRMGLKPNTAISYIRALYARLGISGRHELLASLADFDK